jgi:protein-disulfide isomerase
MAAEDAGAPPGRWARAERLRGTLTRRQETDMNGTRRTALASLALAVGVLLAATGGAADPAAPLSRTAIEEVVRDYLLAHPEVILQSIQAMQDRQRAAQQQQAAQRLAARQDELYREPAAPVGGNPSGDVTVAEFFDYRCRYCRSVAETVAKLVESDPGSGSSTRSSS